jgi:hypothetical protein
VSARLRLFVSIWIAVCAGCATRSTALGQNLDVFSPQWNTGTRVPGGFTRPERPISSAPGRFTRSDEADNALASVPSGAGVTGFDSTNARRKRARRAERPRTSVLSAAQAATARAIAREAQQRYQRDTVPLDLAARGAVTAPVIVPVHRRAPVLGDPYAPIGVRSGSFILFPALELSGGYDSNPLRLRDGPGAGLFTVAPELSLRSGWLRHSLTADFRGSYTAYSRRFDNVGTTTTSSTSLLDCGCGDFTTLASSGIVSSGVPRSLDRPSLESRVNGRLDVHDRSHADVEGRFSVGTDNPGSPNIAAGLARLPIYTRLGGSLGYTQNFNRFDVTVKGGVDRILYEDSSLTDGSTASNEDRQFQQLSAAVRVAYELTPWMKPFAEVLTDTRRHDLMFDRNGIRRDSDMVTGRAGTTFELTRVLIGEASAGYLARQYKDPSLPELAGLVADASLVWLASALTSVTLTARSASDESIVAAVSGVLRRDFVFQVDHAFRYWLIGTARAGIGFDTYASTGTTREDERFFLSAQAVYKLTPEWQMKAEIRRDWLTSNIATADYTANTALVGVRWQR